MQPTEFIWHNGTLVPWREAQVHVLTHTLHYGGGAFEGIRVYDGKRGPAVFRLPEHMDRLIYSANSLKMELPYSRDQLVQATVELLRRNKLRQGYIRPLAYYGYGVMGLNPKGAPTALAIACWPWGAYLPHEAVDVKISKFIRIHPDSTVADAKIVGHYVNSMMAVLDLRGTEFHEALFLDAHGKIAEGPGENFFLIKDGTIYTPPLGTILAGITRNTIFALAESLGIPVVEKSLTTEDAFAGDEAFFTGTAAEVTPIRSIDKKVFPAGPVGPITEKIRSAYLDVVYGRDPHFEQFLTYVEG